MYKGGVGHTSSGLPATDETATSLQSLASAPYSLGHAAAAVHVNGLAE